MRITQTSTGDNAGRFTLHAYHNASNGMDFYLVTHYYSAIAVKSCMLGGDVTQFIDNTVSLTALRSTDDPFSWRPTLARV